MRCFIALILFFNNLTFLLKGISKAGIWKPVAEINLKKFPLAYSKREERRLMRGRQGLPFLVELE
jgi:hypothetical protein